MAMESPSDEILLEEIRKGSSSAFAVLVKRHSGKYYNLAYRYAANREEAEDIIQTAFIKLWENPDAWDPRKGTRFTTWFYRIVVNLCLDGKKKLKPLAIPESFEVRDEKNDQERDVAEGEAKRLLAREIAALPSRQKAALILFFYEGLSHEDAAKAMNIGVKALQSLLMRAKATLKQKMRHYI